MLFAPSWLSGYKVHTAVILVWWPGNSFCGHRKDGAFREIRRTMRSMSVWPFLPWPFRHCTFADCNIVPKSLSATLSEVLPSVGTDRLFRGRTWVCGLHRCNRNAFRRRKRFCFWPVRPCHPKDWGWWWAGSVRPYLPACRPAGVRKWSPSILYHSVLRSFWWWELFS